MCLLEASYNKKKYTWPAYFIHERTFILDEVGVDMCVCVCLCEPKKKRRKLLNKRLFGENLFKNNININIHGLFGRKSEKEKGKK